MSFDVSKFVNKVDQYIKLVDELKRNYSPYKYAVMLELKKEIKTKIELFKLTKNQNDIKWQGQKK